MKCVYSVEVQKQLDEIDKIIEDILISIMPEETASAISNVDSRKLWREYLERIEPYMQMKASILETAVPTYTLSPYEIVNYRNQNEEPAISKEMMEECKKILEKYPFRN